MHESVDVYIESVKTATNVAVSITDDALAYSAITFSACGPFWP